MRHQLFLIGEACEIEADHFVGAKRRLLASPQRDQHARDDRAVGLNLDSILVVAEQVPAAQNVLEKTKKYFDSPTVGEY